MPVYEIHHDESHAEEVTGNRYIVAKVYRGDEEVGQVKLEVIDNGTAPELKVSVSGHLNFDDGNPHRVAIVTEDDGQVE